jgi:DNA primase
MGGLINHPSLLVSKHDAISQLPLHDRKLENLRAVALDAAFATSTLEKDGLQAILYNAGLGVVAEELRTTNALAFSFLRSNADPDRAVQDLSAAIEALAMLPGLDAALAEMKGRFGAATDAADWAEQQRLLSARNAAEEALKALTDGEDEQSV